MVSVLKYILFYPILDWHIFDPNYERDTFAGGTNLVNFKLCDDVL